MTATKAQIDALVHAIERALQQGGDETKLRRALSLAAEASRTPVSYRRDELVREARELLRQVRLLGTLKASVGGSVGW